MWKMLKQHWNYEQMTEEDRQAQANTISLVSDGS